MTVLCTSCLSKYAPFTHECEIKTIIPISGCVECGVVDDRFNGSFRVSLYGGDPREYSTRSALRDLMCGADSNQRAADLATMLEKP